MPWANNPKISSLRMQYNAALAAHSAAKRALIEATVSGIKPSAELVDTATRASAALEDVRAKLLAEMTKAITGGEDVQPPV